MTLDDLPISYLAASVTCASAAIALRKAGPAACGMPPSAYVSLIESLEKSAEMTGLLERLRAEKAASRGEPGRAAS